MAGLRARWFQRRAREQCRSVPDKCRVYVIGDIHGCAELLSRILNFITADLKDRPIEEPWVVLLGDYVDRGLGSRVVLDILTTAPLPARCIPLRGNHEQMLLDFLVEPHRGIDWIRNGGLETLHSYGIDVRPLHSWGGYAEIAAALRARLPPLHLGFLERTMPRCEIGDYFFCHAGVRPGVPLKEQSDVDLLWIRDPFLSAKCDFGKMIVHGHTPVDQPSVLHNRINIDTGAYISGKLTCLILEDSRTTFVSTNSSRRDAWP
ncbi:metallophosphoesterase family protein [Methylobacterium durans]|uniref:metallophosphoesterase family protein n=1 Tax=Methylobacterium durans TaxID=2202825 RepID=UPI0013A59FDA|nr:metallophosphoesterase family protein [Methylobacterium durans]